MQVINKTKYIKYGNFNIKQLPQLERQDWRVIGEEYQEDKETYIRMCRYSPISKNELSRELIAQKFDLKDELKLINLGINNPNNAEYLEYRIYVDECIQNAKDFVAERERFYQEGISNGN